MKMRAAALVSSSSKRAKGLVALCSTSLNDADGKSTKATLHKRSTVAARNQNCSPISPISTWWDDIYEAGDICRKQGATYKNKPLFKRRLVFHSTPSTNTGYTLTKAAPALSHSTWQQELSLLVSKGGRPPLKDGEAKRPFKQSNNKDSTPNAVPDPVADPAEQQVCMITSTANDQNVTDKFSSLINSEAFSPAVVLYCGEPERLTVPENCEGFSSGLSNTLDNIQVDVTNSQDQVGMPQPCIDFLSGDENLFPSQIKILQTKLALNSGVEHVNSVGKVRKARKLLKPCKDSCNRCEKPKLDDNERDLISSSFWNLKNHGQQWLFIHNAVKLSATQRKSCIKGTKGEKLFNRHYSVVVDGKRRKVCKTMFKSTLNICDSWIVNALSHCSDKKLVIPDQRGKHRSLPASC